jgi:hypothetical protein
MRHTTQVSGQSLVEFAIIASLLITMLLGTVDFALAFSNQMAIRGAVAEGAYVIAQSPDDDADAEERIRLELEHLPGAADPGRLDVAINALVCSGGRAERTVTVGYRHEFWFASVLPGAEAYLQSSTTVPQFGGCQ